MVELADLTDVAAMIGEIDGVVVRESVPSGPFCTYRVGGPLALLAEVSSREALIELAGAIAVRQVDTLVIGRGSNLLVADVGFAGLAIRLTEECGTVEIDGTTVVAGAAADLPRVARATVNADLTGFEWAVGVPGTIGGAVRMNAGGHGSDMAASLRSVELVDLHLGGQVVRPVESLGLGYRTSNVEPWQIVVSATLELQRYLAPSGGKGARLPTASEGGVSAVEEAGDGAADGAELLREIVAWRRTHQPGGANAGSVFTNPPDDSAGRLIDAAGLKGMRIGSAEVSEKHANFIQADPDGSADDIVELMTRIVDRVEAEHGVRLHAETQLVGFAPDLVAKVQSPEVPHASGLSDETWGNP